MADTGLVALAAMSRGALFSSVWYRVANLRPALARQAAFARHVYRGQPWHVVDDRTSERRHRFTPAAYFVIGLLDGERTVDEVWRAALERLGDAAPTQDEVVRLLAQLHAADLLVTETPSDLASLGLRAKSAERQTWLRAASAPLAHRVPLFDADRLFDWLAPLGRAVFSRLGMLAWLAVVLAGAATASRHWRELSEDVSERVLAPWSLATLLLAYLVLKILHEAWHGLALKAGGGRVQDIGVMMLLFLPLPYVDASSSTAFPSKWRRALVASAGLMVELFCASIAIMLWVHAEPGPFRSFLFSVAFIGCVSALLFNGNPLLKFDGYFILSDLIEIPNLAQRSQAYLGYLLRRLLGDREAISPVSAGGERLWFLLYGPLAAVYRVVLAFSIALFLASEYALLGAVLALWTLLVMVLWPVFRTATGLVRGGNGRTARAAALGTMAVGVAAWVLFAAPAPRSTVAEGVWSVAEGGQVRSEADGVLAEFIAAPGSSVAAGDALMRLEDPAVDAELRAFEAELIALRIRLATVAFADQVQALLLREEIGSVSAQRDRIALRKGAQVVRAGVDGIFMAEPEAEQRAGAFFARGGGLGYVADAAKMHVAAVVGQDGIGAIQAGVRAVELRDADLGPAVAARVLRVVPGGRNRLPHRALSAEAGGPFALDPRAQSELRTLETVFQIDVAPDVPSAPALIGRRAHVRFIHDPEPLGFQALRAARRVILARLLS